MDCGRIHLFVFMTEGMSLAKWRDLGMLGREMALYVTLRPHLAGITIVSYGDREDDGVVAAFPGIDVVCNRWRLPQGVYRRLQVGMLRRACRGVALYKSNQTSGADLALSLARRGGVPFIARCGYMLSDFKRRADGEGSEPYRKARNLERRVFTAADRCQVTTAAMKRQVVAYGVTEDRVAIVPNYVDTDLFMPAVAEPSARPRVVFVGRLSAQKNPLLLVRALEGLDVELDMVGQGELRGEVEEEAARRGVPVTFHGNLPHEALPRVINEGAVFVLPSLYEGHPKTLLEAMACGAAVVGSAVPGIQEVIDSGRTGLLCEPTAVALRSAVQRLLKDPALGRRLGAEARRYVEHNLSLDRIAELELSAYRDVLAQSARKASFAT